MIQISPNVYAESSIPVCNLGLVTTTEGIVLIDSPMKPSDAVKWRDEANKKGKVSYLIITEEHPDHWMCSWFLHGTLITSQETREKLSNTPVAPIKDMIERSDPEASALMASYQLRLADISFNDSLNLYLGDHVFSLFLLPGHSPGGIGVYLPQERVVFTTDCVFHKYKTWLQDSEPDKWLESLRKLGELDVDVVVPGHGEICKKDYLKEQASIIQQWVEVVQSAIKKGLSEAEAVAQISVPDPYPPQPGVPFPASEINRLSIARLYKLYAN